MRRGPSKNCGVCQTTFGDSDCYHIDGEGTAFNPFRPLHNFADDADSLLECGPAGAAAFAPTWLLNPPACHIYSDNDFDLFFKFDVGQLIIFNQTRYDTDSMHDKDNAPSRISIRTSGVYRFQLNIRWKKIDTLDQGDQAAFVRKNGSTFLNLDSMSIGGPDLFGSQSLVIEEPMEAGDWVEAFVKQDAVAGPLETDLPVTSTRSSPNFVASFLRPPSE